MAAKYEVSPLFRRRHPQLVTQIDGKPVTVCSPDGKPVDRIIEATKETPQMVIKSRMATQADMQRLYDEQRGMGYVVKVEEDDRAAPVQNKP